MANNNSNKQRYDREIHILKADKEKLIMEYSKEVEELTKQIEDKNYIIMDHERDCNYYKVMVSDLQER